MCNFSAKCHKRQYYWIWEVDIVLACTLLHHDEGPVCQLRCPEDDQRGGGNPSEDLDAQHPQHPDPKEVHLWKTHPGKVRAILPQTPMKEGVKLSLGGPHWITFELAARKKKQSFLHNQKFVTFIILSKCCKIMQNSQTVRNWKIIPFSFTNCA